MEDNCSLCNRTFYTLKREKGKDLFILETEKGILVENKLNTFVFKGALFSCEKRLSFCIFEHRLLNEKEVQEIKNHIRKILFQKYSYVEGEHYNFYILLRSIPNHWHIHMCIKPITFLRIIE